ncbi:MAG: 3'-5' exonuclease, partial [Bacteroidota bacterium]
GEKIKVIKAMTDGEEGRRVADSILEQKNRYHLSNTNIAILYRTNSQSRVFEEYLRRYNIRYKVYGGQSFYQRKEVKDLIAYLRAATNPKDDEAYKRIINYPKRGIGKTTVDKITAFADEHDISFWEAMGQIQLTKRTTTLLRGFQTLILGFNRKANSADAYEAALHISKGSGLHKTLKSDSSMEGIGRFENFNALLDGVKEFVDNDEVTNDEVDNDKSLGTYLQNIALLTDQDDEGQEDDFVTLMSIHSAKGLEFKSVFIVGLEENLFPSYMSMHSADQLDEERRLFYVAITRAERFLTLSYANCRYQFGQMRYNDPSRFLEEIPQTSLLSFGVSRSTKPDFSNPRIVGNFNKPRKKNLPDLVSEADFNPSPQSAIKEGVKVLHRKFGKGTVVNIDGHKNNLLATIEFEGIENPKRIALKYAKLQVMD